ncbi:MAG: hypothetical protein COT43_07700, partial [Candidatus Marinimicrobia bacterium CG08_land_8_20_14_0_20_45_22]
DFYPLFKLSFTDVSGLILTRKKQGITRLMDLKNRDVYLPSSTDWFFLNPIILFLIKNCTINSANKSAYSIPTALLSPEVEDNTAAVVATTLEYKLLNEKEKQGIQVLGEFPLVPESVVVAGPDLKSKNLSIIKDEIEKWLATKSDLFSDIGIRYSKENEKTNSLIYMEAIEGLGYNLKEFIEVYPNLLLNMIGNNQSYELKVMKEKYERLATFNDKLVSMYREIRDSRDRLSKVIESASDNSILFLKDGTVLGISRSFAHILNQNRQDIIGKEITMFLETTMNTPFKSLIQQIDYGLVKSFYVRLKNNGDNSAEFKMEFSLIELLDSKIILGMFSKNK